MPNIVTHDLPWPAFLDSLPAPTAPFLPVFWLRTALVQHSFHLLDKHKCL